MKAYYNLDAIQTEIGQEIDRKEAALAAWEAVTFPTKKDGSQFKVLSKNISGATLYLDEYAMQPGENKLRIVTWSKRTGSVVSSIDIYCLVKYLKDEKKKAKTENYMPKQTYLEQVYRYDLEDIKEAVTAKIDRLQTEIQQLKEQLEISSIVFHDFRKAYGEALEKLEKDSKKESNSTLYYMILETVKNRYPYC